MDRQTRGLFTREFLLAFLANFFFFANLSSFFLLPLRIKDLGGTEDEIGLIMGVYTSTAIILQPVVGGWVDRLGRRRFMLAGVLLVGLASLAFVFASRLGPVFPILRVLQGVGFSAFFVANFTYISDLVPPERRGEALGVFGASGLASTALGPSLGEFIVQAFGFRAHFLFATLLACVALALVSAGRETPRLVVLRSEGITGLLLSLREVRLAAMLVAVAFGLGLGAIFTFLPTYARAVGIQRLAGFFLAYTGAAIAVRFLGGRLIDTVGSRVIITPSLIVQALGTTMLTFLATVPLLPLIGILTGAAHGFLYPALSVLVISITTEQHRGRVVGLFSSAVLLGHTLGAIAMGFVVHAFGYPAMFGFLSFLLFAGAALSLRLGR